MASLFPLLKEVNDDRQAVEITSKGGNGVLAYLFRSPANTSRLLEGLEQARSGNVEEHQLLQ